MDKKEIYENCVIVGNSIKLQTFKIDKELYLSISKELNSLGGIFKGGGFKFDKNPTEILNKLKKYE